MTRKVGVYIYRGYLLPGNWKNDADFKNNENDNNKGQQRWKWITLLSLDSMSDTLNTVTC